MDAVGQLTMFFFGFSDWFPMLIDCFHISLPLYFRLFLTTTSCALYLSNMLQAIETSDTSVPDMLCLCGRIYKDKYVESKCKDTTSLQHAIDWCDLSLIVNYVSLISAVSNLICHLFLWITVNIIAE